MSGAGDDRGPPAGLPAAAAAADRRERPVANSYLRYPRLVVCAPAEYRPTHRSGLTLALAHRTPCESPLAIAFVRRRPGSTEHAAGGGRVRRRSARTTGRQDGQRAATGARAASLGADSCPPHRRRWVPPSSLREHDVPDGDVKHDIIFRKVRGILNKLTPEKFQKLSDDLLGLELDSDKVLKGVILLIFEKALDEPKYSSMYAQLCKRLSEEAPNLEPAPQPCTFRLLLLNKCRAEFENRAQAFAAFEERALAPEDEERRHLAKCKMLGNIKFIGELGKLEILAESILHRCIQNLLARRAAADHHEDLECLAQLVRTCGRVLDSERGRGLMDQYFARIETLSQSRELAPRIRFMLRDVVELRRGGWTPRAAVSAEGPVPIQQLRHDHEPRRDTRHDRDRDRDRDRHGDALFRSHRSRPLDDVLAGLALQPPSALVPPPDKLFGNGFGGRDAFRQRSAPSAPSYYAHQRPAHFGKHAAANGKEPPRLHKARLPAAGAGALEDVQMRPAAYSLMFTASANRLPKQHAPAPPLLLPPPAPQKSLGAGAGLPGGALLKEPAITIKPAPDKRDKPKKDKVRPTPPPPPHHTGFTYQAVPLHRGGVPSAGGGGGGGRGGGGADEAPAAARIRAAALPDKLLRRAMQALFEHVLALPAPATGAAWDDWARAAVALVRGVKRAPVPELLRALLPAAGAAPAPRLAALLAHAARARLVSLQEVAGWPSPPAPRALLLDKKDQPVRVRDGVRRGRHGHGGGRGGGRGRGRGRGQDAGGAGAGAEAAALDALEARGLGALVPQLRVAAALGRALAAEPAPAALYRWIKAHVEPAVRQEPAFVSTLVALLAAHVTAAAGSQAGADKPALEREKQLAEAYAPLLTALLQGRQDLQLAAVYAVNTWLTWLQQQESEDEEAED
ncbi:hypothetical protein MSG28_001862 [Choristoneura fumiferana]|uniref:Uncharacterized protein n=1 Tax=Choristoneura fumiferana TaxID=7141 RepID=A0ACC0KW07_CHOFU|nr:hypothetical protein MSG28_001862 [Choristoneura fumiferana]